LPTSCQTAVGQAGLKARLYVTRRYA